MTEYTGFLALLFILAFPGLLFYATIYGIYYRLGTIIRLLGVAKTAGLR